MNVCMKEHWMCHSNIISSSAESVKDYVLTLAVYITNLKDALLQPASTVWGSACLLSQRLLHFAHTHKYHPKSRNVLHCIIVFIIVFICYDPVLVPGILKQCDIQYNRKRNTLTTSPKKHNPRPPIFISDFREKTSPKSLIISRLGNCSLCVQMADWCGTC